jgi:hypothetical protein
MKQVTLAVLMGVAVLSLTPGVSYAQAGKNQGYIVDRNGNTVKMARTGDCIRLTRQWSQAVETPECRAASTKASQSAEKR